MCFEKLEPEPLETLFTWLKKYNTTKIHKKQYDLYEKYIFDFLLFEKESKIILFFNIFNKHLKKVVYYNKNAPNMWNHIFNKINSTLDSDHVFIDNHLIIKIKYLLHTSLPST